jgi:hypothetical protein
MGETNTRLANVEHLQWHPAFFAGLQIEFVHEADKLIFENEHHIGTKPKQIDVLVIKKEADTPIEKNIGKIFRKHNIIEYKSPSDTLNVDDFYLVYAYACLYKSDTNTVNAIAAEDITITFVCHHFPRSLIKHLKKLRNYKIQQMENGIYYIHGDFFPIQLLVTQELTNEQNLWLHNLTNTIHDSTVITTLLNEYEQHHDEKYYQSVMNVITKANTEKFKEVTGMCEALEEIYLSIHGERLKREQQAAVDKAVAETIDKVVAEAVAEAVAKAVAETTAKITAEKDAYIRQLEAQLGIATV